MKQAPLNPAAPDKYLYDAEDRLVTYCKETTGTCLDRQPSTNRTLYTYDADGRRVTKQEGLGSQTVFVHDAWGNLAAEYGTADVGGTQYLTSDHLGSVRVVTDAGERDASGAFTRLGAPIARMDYEPFGRELGVGTGDPRFGVAGYGSDAGRAIRQKFTGKERDAESGLDYFFARYYSGPQGRFTSSDVTFAAQRSEAPQTWNLYAYARNNPQRYIDPSGRQDNPTSCQPGDDACFRATEQALKKIFTKDFWTGALKELKNQAAMLTYGFMLSGAVEQGVNPSDLPPAPELEAPANSTEEAGMAVTAATQIAVGGLRALGAGARAETVSLFRAVRPSELTQIKNARAFMNPAGAEGKYFSTTLEGAQSYAAQATRAFGDGPYAIVQTSLPRSALRPDMITTVDRGVPTVVVPTRLLPRLSRPRILR